MKIEVILATINSLSLNLKSVVFILHIKNLDMIIKTILMKGKIHVISKKCNANRITFLFIITVYSTQKLIKCIQN